jgi:molybdopterin synthase sulfur carrier subunit
MTLQPFGQLTEIVTGIEISSDGLHTAGELKNRLLEMYPDLASIPFRIAVNNRFSPDDMPVNPEDTIALLPPFAGG